VTGLAALRAEVTARYDRLGLPSWPDPHPGLAAPRDDEYSRVTKPERYAIGFARARVWTEVLAERSGIEVTTLEPAPLDRDGRHGRIARAVRLTSSRSATLPLLLLERDEPLPVLHLSVVRPEVLLQMQPYCGCDACDDGSAYLLDQIDETIGQVVGGPLVVLRGTDWHATWHPEGGSSGGSGRGPDPDQVMQWCRRLAAGESVRLPRGTEAFVGRPWFDEDPSPTPTR
jgi:hypothetical protein